MNIYYVPSTMLSVRYSSLNKSDTVHPRDNIQMSGGKLVKDK